MKRPAFKLTACFAAASLLLGGCSVPDNTGLGSTVNTTSGSSEQSQPKIDFSQYRGYGFLGLQNDAERILYANVDKAIRSLTPEAFTTPKLDDFDHISDVLDFYLHDHPDVFWLPIQDSYTCRYYEGEPNMTVTLNYSVSGDELTEAQEELDAIKRSVLDSAPDGAYERELFFHDYLMNNCEYDDGTTEGENADKSTAYGALVKRKAVCEGYARAFELLCTDSGIPSWVVTGKGINTDGSEEFHIWNIVQLDGSWYHVDVTWDDSDGDVDHDIYQYLYFNVTDEEIRQDHTFSPLYSDYSDTDINYNVFLPQCTDTAYSYYRRNSQLLSDLDSGEPAAYLAKQAANGAREGVFRLDSGMDLTDTYHAILNEYAYSWLTSANEINGYSPAVADTCYVSYSDIRGLITVSLDYL